MPRVCSLLFLDSSCFRVECCLMTSFILVALTPTSLHFHFTSSSRSAKKREVSRGKKTEIKIRNPKSSSGTFKKIKNKSVQYGRRNSGSWSSRALSKICIFFIFCMRYVHRTRIKSEFRRGDPIPDVRWESICPTLQLVNAFTHSWIIVRRRRRRHRI